VTIETVGRRVALGSDRARRATHRLTSVALSIGWRRTWVVDDPAANRPSRAMSYVRAAWRESLPPRGVVPADEEPISVMIPVGPLDTEVAALAVAGVRANLLDPIDSITIVTPSRLVDRMTVEVPDESVVAEETVLTADQVAMVRGGTPPDRSNWYLQQLVKLQFCRAGTTRRTLVIDADTVLVRPQRSRTVDGTALFAAHEYHQSYFDHLARLLGDDFSRPVFATTSHQMLYDRDVLDEIVTSIERHHPDRTWPEAIVDLIDAQRLSGFSEGELYGQWMVQHHPADVSIHPFANTGLRRADALPVSVSQLSARFGTDHDSVSLHHWL